MSAMASQITGVSICSTVCSGADHRKHQSSVSLAFVREIHRWPVNSPHKGPVARKMFPFDDVIMIKSALDFYHLSTSEIVRRRHGSVYPVYSTESLRWRHNGPDSDSNHQPHDCLLNRFIQTQIKENIKAPRHWPLCGEFTGDRWIPRTNGQQRGKCFHLMTSSCGGWRPDDTRGPEHQPWY